MSEELSLEDDGTIVRDGVRYRPATEEARKAHSRGELVGRTLVVYRPNELFVPVLYVEVE